MLYSGRFCTFESSSYFCYRPKAEVFGAKGNKLSKYFGSSQKLEAVDALV